jgi:hypothetical protein
MMSEDEINRRIYAMCADHWQNVANFFRWAPAAMLILFCACSTPDADPFAILRVVTLYIGLPCWAAMLLCLAAARHYERISSNGVR